MNLKRIWDQNSRLIILGVGIVLFIIILIKMLNFYYEKQEEKRQINLQKIIEEDKKDESELTESDYSIESDSVKKAMRSFVKYCNEQRIDEAYQMLTEDCKEELYPNIDKFKKDYIDIVFYTKRDYEIKQWSISGYTEVYMVTLYEDMLATGGLGDIRTEYYTFNLDKNGVYKLSINNFIKKEKKNKEITESGIKLKIEQVNTYSDCQEIKLSITNETNNKINLTSKRSDSIYLQSSSGTKFSALDSEFATSQVILEPNKKKTFTIKFNNFYNLSNLARKLVIEDIIMNYDEFLQLEDKTTYTDLKTITIGY